MAGKGDHRRPEAERDLFARGWDRVFGVHTEQGVPENTETLTLDENPSGNHGENKHD